MPAKLSALTRSSALKPALSDDSAEMPLSQSPLISKSLKTPRSLSDSATR
ncbi:hypothetical protein [Lysobacter gummosus]